MYTIGRFSKLFNVSRSTMLYYDKIGLLKPTGRSLSNYRVYSENDRKRMEQIEFYKKAGVRLKDISTIMNSEKKNKVSHILEDRLKQLAEEINYLKHQQTVITSILGSDGNIVSASSLNKEQWIDILKAAGLDEAGMKLWHQAFELTSPKAHKQFMIELGMDEKDILSVIKWCKLGKQE